MMDIEFSVMVNSPGDENALLPLLNAFEQQYHIHVKVVGVPWVAGWTEIVKYGIYGNGPDVSCVGMSWIGSLASMQSLRSFTLQETRALGGANAFFESAWRTGFLPQDPTPWAIPWLGDVVVMYYWRDALEKAGIKDIQAAFATNAALVTSLKKLQKCGYPYPLALTTSNISMNLHEAAYWLWDAGGDFMSADFQKVTFDQPAALKGLKNYFCLQPFISPETLSVPSAGDLFINGRAVVTFASPWLGVVGCQLHPEWEERLGAIALPGPAYVGGASFVIWQYSKHSREAFELVRFLSSQPTRIPAAPHDHQLPTRSEAVHMPSLESNHFHRAFLQGLQGGRSFPTARLWGSVEDKLVIQITNIWKERFANPTEDLDVCLHRNIDPLAQRLNRALGN